LNHVHAGATNILRLSGHSGHGRTCRWLEPVANDPDRTSENFTLNYLIAGSFAGNQDIAFAAANRSLALWR
jgi:hypothetical protein